MESVREHSKENFESLFIKGIIIDEENRLNLRGFGLDESGPFLNGVHLVGRRIYDG